MEKIGMQGDAGMAAQCLEKLRVQLEGVWIGGEERLLPSELKHLSVALDKIDVEYNRVGALLEKFEKIAIKEEEYIGSMSEKMDGQAKEVLQEQINDML